MPNVSAQGCKGSRLLVKPCSVTSTMMAEHLMHCSNICMS